MRRVRGVVRHNVDDGDDHDGVMMARKVMVSVIMMIMVMAVLERDPRGSKVLERCDWYQIQK